jgi:hypothetical protein
MSRRRRKSSKQAAATHSLLGRRATIWLATLSTVVGLATGMFTLRDRVFPNESGSAAAVSLPTYQQEVGRICDELNEDDHRRAAEVAVIRKKLRRATTTLAQRNALLDGQRRTIARPGHTLATFTALATPDDLLAARRTTMAAWNLNLGRLRAYAQRLDRAGTRAELLAAIGYLSDLRPQLAETGVALMAGLRSLGGSSCDIRTPIVTPAFSLPAHRRTDGPGAADVDGPGPTGTSSPNPTHTFGAFGAPKSPYSGPSSADTGPMYAAPPRRPSAGTGGTKGKPPGDG